MKIHVIRTVYVFVVVVNKFILSVRSELNVYSCFPVHIEF